MNKSEKRIHGGKEIISYTNGYMTTTSAAWHAKGEGNNIVIKVDSTTTAFQEK